MYQKPNEFSNWERQLAKKYKQNSPYLDALRQSIVNRHIADRTQNLGLWKKKYIKDTLARSVFAFTVVMLVLISDGPDV